MRRPLIPSGGIYPYRKVTIVNDALQGDETTTSYAVEGLTCGHCASAVTEEVMALDSVTSVDVQLVAGATSTVSVMSSTQLDVADLQRALSEAGDYRLVSEH